MSVKTTDAENQGNAKVTSISHSTKDEGDMAQGIQVIDRLATTFENSARRWEVLVYPSLFAFIVLAGFGFYLIYNLTHDVASLAHNVNTLTESMNDVVISMGQVSGDMKTISTEMSSVSGKMNNLEPMRASIDSMNQAAHSMAMSTDAMRHHMGSMNYNVARPMGMFNSFMPW